MARQKLLGVRGTTAAQRARCVELEASRLTSQNTGPSAPILVVKVSGPLRCQWRMSLEEARRETNEAFGMRKRKKGLFWGTGEGDRPSSQIPSPVPREDMTEQMTVNHTPPARSASSASRPPALSRPSQNDTMYSYNGSMFSGPPPNSPPYNMVIQQGLTLSSDHEEGSFRGLCEREANNKVENSLPPAESLTTSAGEDSSHQKKKRIFWGTGEGDRPS
ncbi:hypothetical protein MMC18_004597, partial [Xylographa bjoerkii]|nr:hypothetical protein [Xylographa bjoerkii]